MSVQRNHEGVDLSTHIAMLIAALSVAVVVATLCLLSVGTNRGRLEVQSEAVRLGLGEFISTNGVSVEFRWIK